MSIFSFLLILFLVRFLQKSLANVDEAARLKRLLPGLNYAAILLLFVDLSTSNRIVTWLWHCLLIFLLVIVTSHRQLKQARSILIAISPYIIISLLSDLLKTFFATLYSRIENVLQPAILFSALWMIATYFNLKKQQKKLEYEITRRKQEEDLNKVISARKGELEALVAERTSQLVQKNEQLERALTELQATQAQLVQKEKLASLGELTAGIAHEIQNPLNFVNNFSEVSTELVSEMKEQLRTGNSKGVMALTDTVGENLLKITEHGRRADSIVKGMLEHSKGSTGERTATDINALLDEYLNLAYNSYWRKENVNPPGIVKQFDKGLPSIQAVPEELGRVFLNLFNNAFYSMREKQKLKIDNFVPELVVTTQRSGSCISVRIRDNGIGIPDKIKSKIMQPFFTTKPAGEGTGLGLSLSYEIIVKGYRGELKAESVENDYAEFTILLPCS